MTPENGAVTAPTAARRACQHAELIDAMRCVGDAIARPAPTREVEWARHVAQALARLLESLTEHHASAEGHDGLYHEIETAMPRAAQRVHYLRHTNRAIQGRARLLVEEVERVALPEGGAFMAVRASATDLLGEIRNQQAREVDLLFEAFQLDLGGPG